MACDAAARSDLTQGLRATAYTNPFASIRIDSLTYVPETESIEALLRRARQLRFRCMILGPHGSGKSTLLREIAQRLVEDGYIVRRCRIKPSRSRRHKLRAFLSRVDRRRILTLDGADHLSPIEWGFVWWKSRAAAGLIVTSHGRPLLPLLTRRQTTLQVLEILCNQLGVSSALSSGMLRGLFIQHQGNIRDIFRHLYDIWAGVPDPKQCE
jgi:GTPase SAR1 family protein